MAADMKHLRTRIKSIDSTQHLTHAMGLVASSKIRRANQQMEKAKEYALALSQTVARLSADPGCSRSAYLRRPQGERTLLVVIAGDRGMAGGYNANVLRLAKCYPQAQVIPLGKRAGERYGQAPISSEHFSYSQAKELAHRLCREFTQGQVDRIGIVSTKYISMMQQEPQLSWLFPLPQPEKAAPGATEFEPDELTVLEHLMPEYLCAQLIKHLRESFACEVAARRVAMDNAGKNANEMLYRLGLEYNRARQSAITQEITEIVAGSGR